VEAQEIKTLFKTLRKLKFGQGSDQRSGSGFLKKPENLARSTDDKKVRF
jgi:hypothetical protein